jgi:hypothetical protein
VVEHFGLGSTSWRMTGEVFAIWSEPHVAKTQPVASRLIDAHRAVMNAAVKLHNPIACKGKQRAQRLTP